MMVKVDDDLARAAVVYWFSVNPTVECRPDDETDFVCYTDKGPTRVKPSRRGPDGEVTLAASLVPEWLAELFKVGNVIAMSREDFYRLPAEVRRYMEAL